MPAMPSSGAPGLTLPHPEMLNRVFVLLPLAEIAPDRIIGGRSVAEAAAALPRSEGDVDAARRSLSLTGFVRGDAAVL